MIGFGLVATLEFAFRHGKKFLLDDLLAERGEVIYKHFSFQLVELMLDDTCYDAIHPLVVRLEVGIEVLDAYLLGTSHLLVYAWHGEASFLEVALLFAFFDDVSVDECLEVDLELRLILADAVEVDDYDADW